MPNNQWLIWDKKSASLTEQKSACIWVVLFWIFSGGTSKDLVILETSQYRLYYNF